MKPAREAVVDHRGDVTIESYAVMYDGDAASVAHVACRLPDGRRSWANASDRDTVSAMTRDEFCGRAARIDGAGALEVLG